MIWAPCARKKHVASALGALWPVLPRGAQGAAAPSTHTKGDDEFASAPPKPGGGGLGMTDPGGMGPGPPVPIRESGTWEPGRGGQGLKHAQRPRGPKEPASASMELPR